MKCGTTPSPPRCFHPNPRPEPMTFDPSTATAGEIARAVATGQVSALAVTDAALAAIKRDNPRLNAFTAVIAERARARAQTLDDKRKQGGRLGSLAGVPFAAKNLFDIAGLPTLAGSKINRE